LYFFGKIIFKNTENQFFEKLKSRQTWKYVHCRSRNVPVLLRHKKNGNRMKHVLLLCLLLNALVAPPQNYWEELPAPPGVAPTQITQTANG